MAKLHEIFMQIKQETISVLFSYQSYHNSVVC